MVLKAVKHLCQCDVNIDLNFEPCSIVSFHTFQKNRGKGSIDILACEIMEWVCSRLLDEGMYNNIEGKGKKNTHHIKP